VARLFLAPACVQASFSAADEKLRWACTDVGLHGTDNSGHHAGMCAQVCRHAQRRNPNPITHLQYFADIVEEVREYGDSRKLLGAAPIEGWHGWNTWQKGVRQRP